jgi:DNA-binding transcriptional MerR regulator
VVDTFDDTLGPEPAEDRTSGDPSTAGGRDPAGAATPAEDPRPGAESCFTIDELAVLSGVPSRTIRFYQSKGTLPAPERRGRVAYYSLEHVERLRVIAELQDRGLRLDAIRDALAEVGRGGEPLSLQAWLGMGDELQAPWSDDHPVVFSEAELLDRVGNRPGMLAELRRLNFIERQGNSRPATYVVPSAVLLGIGLELGHAGIDPLVAFEASEIMRLRLGRLVDELVAFFADRTGEGFGGSGEPEEIAASVDALRRQSLRAVQVIFAHEIERSLRELVERGGAMPQARRIRLTGVRSADHGPPADAGGGGEQPAAPGAGDAPAGGRAERRSQERRRGS